MICTTQGTRVSYLLTVWRTLEQREVLVWLHKSATPREFAKKFEQMALSGKCKVPMHALDADTKRKK